MSSTSTDAGKTKHHLISIYLSGKVLIVQEKLAHSPTAADCDTGCSIITPAILIQPQIYKSSNQHQKIAMLVSLPYT